MTQFHTYRNLAIVFCLILFAIDPVLLVDAAKAATISVTIRPTNNPSQQFGGQLPQLFELRAKSSLLQLEVPEPDDIDRAIHYQLGDPVSRSWKIREADAPNYGLDWTAFQNNLNGLGALATLQFGNGPPVQTFFSGISAFGSTESALKAAGLVTNKPIGFANFDMDEIRVSVNYFFWHPVLSALRAASVSFEIDGVGTVIPEPTSLVLAAMAFLSLGIRRRNVE